MSVLLFLGLAILLTGTMMLSSYFITAKNDKGLGMVFSVAGFVIAVYASGYYFGLEQFTFAVAIILFYVDSSVGNLGMNLYNRIRKELRNGEY